MAKNWKKVEDSKYEIIWENKRTGKELGVVSTDLPPEHPSFNPSKEDNDAWDVEYGNFPNHVKVLFLSTRKRDAIKFARDYMRKQK